MIFNLRNFRQKSKDTIRIGFSDNSPATERMMLEFLSAHFNIEITNNCDFLIHAFGQYGADGQYGQFLSHNAPVRIFFSQENIIPDFNISDYAIGFPYIEFGDRYCRGPNYLFYDSFDYLSKIKQTQPGNPEELKFCNFIYSNGNCHPYRDAFFKQLHAIKHVDAAGGHLNNCNTQPQAAFSAGWEAAKVAFQRNYKFSIAMENSSTPGYTTEKIVHALAAGTIPIYFGDSLVARQFNSKRFINCHDFDNEDQVISRIIEIDNNDELFYSILNEPFFPPDLPDQKENLKTFFAHIFSQEPTTAKRRNPHVWGPMYESRVGRSKSPAS
ncbi:glycosyltransferase family 10 domain-containing protein [Bosea sp. NPDC003192]|uniref:glycosyltransferase family 10 domain-containing protein n=1 Tax=Bosea sp. NPDC003192 TaxID=3390551 RepID=UPI003D017BA1